MAMRRSSSVIAAAAWRCILAHRGAPGAAAAVSWDLRLLPTATPTATTSGPKLPAGFSFPGVSGLHTSVQLQYAKKGGKGGKAAPAAVEDAEVPEFSLKPYEQMMSHAASHFQQELGKIHAGRASPGLLEPIEVLAHGEKQPLKNLGTVTARTASLLVVAPFSIGDAELVAKAIRESPLQLQARVENNEVQVPVPRPSLDQIKGLVKLVSQEAEKVKHSVRGARHKAMEQVKATIKAKDEKQRVEKQVQALTDRWIADVDRLRQTKDKELEAQH